VPEDDVHRGNIDDCSARAFALKPRVFGARRYGHLGLDRSARPSGRAAMRPYDAPASKRTQLSYTSERSSAGCITATSRMLIDRSPSFIPLREPVRYAGIPICGDCIVQKSWIPVFARNEPNYEVTLVVGLKRDHQIYKTFH
jgi:hypothetical protein